MKRYSTVLLLAGWLILIYVISSITFAALGKDEQDDSFPNSSQTSQVAESVNLKG